MIGHFSTKKKDQSADWSFFYEIISLQLLDAQTPGIRDPRGTFDYIEHFVKDFVRTLYANRVQEGL